MIQKQEILKLMESERIRIKENKLDELQKHLSEKIREASLDLNVDNVPELITPIDFKEKERKDIPQKSDLTPKGNYLTIKRIL
ncbi:MAG: hypothetical protein WC157_01400 [Candidatus Paceibacterota bacterium]